MRKTKLIFTLLLSLIFISTLAACKEHVCAWGDWMETTAPTCTVDGVETRVCKTNSSHKETQVKKSAGHAWGEWEEVDGVTISICKRDSSHTKKDLLISPWRV